ncbi:MAG: JAB domain-containing protein [Nanoarchaeota archaeon]
MQQVIYLKENSDSIKNAKTIFDNISKIKVDYEQENFLVFFLDTRLEIIDTEVLFKGGLNSCLIDPKTIFRKALLKNSAAIIVSHNHPSRNLSPSSEDIESFNELKKIGELLDLSVLDSIIFDENKYYSLSENDN